MSLAQTLGRTPTVRNTRLARHVRSLVWRARRRPDQDRLREAGMEIGANVQITGGAYLDPGFPWLISIGNDTVLSPDVVVLAHDASTRKHIGYTRLASVRIGSNVYIGARSVILPGVTIGDDAIVAAGSVVRHTVEPGTMVGGVPARPLGRVADYTARHLAALQNPRWPKEGWTVAGGITDEKKRLMQEALRDGEGYVK